MSTRSRIGRRNPDGSVTSIYCHFDGYPAGVGATLARHYTDPAKIDALIVLGDISSLAPECQDPPAGHSYHTGAAGHTVAYMRDRGEYGCEAVTHPADAWPDSGQECTYLWDGSAWITSH